MLLPNPPHMPMLPIHLAYGADLRRALESIAADQTHGSAFVVAGIGVPLEGWALLREHDTATGYSELVVRRRD